jgi:hypothetical protein
MLAAIVTYVLWYSLVSSGEYLQRTFEINHVNFFPNSYPLTFDSDIPLAFDAV